MIAFQILRWGMCCSRKYNLVTLSNPLYENFTADFLCNK
jgi:hypothetical protein